MLRLEGLVLRQGSFELRADLAVNAGDICAVMGPSGAGKSTLLNAIAGFLPVDQGRILWGEQDLTQRVPQDRPVAMLFQDQNLFPHMSAEANVALALTPRARLSDEVRAKVAGALEQVGLKGLGARKPAALSGGQQSRVALARVVLQDRPVLLLDEPFAALGPALKIEMLDMVKALAKAAGVTVLMVSHDPDDAHRIADKIVVVSDGVTAAPEEARTVLENPPDALRAYLG